MNYKIKLNLKALKNAFVTRINGKTTAKTCLVIPIQDANLYLGEKGCYLKINAWENKDGAVGKFGDTHWLIQSFEKEAYDQMSEEERRALPFLGNMQPRQVQPSAAAMAAVTSTTTVAEGSEDDLPF